MDSFPFELLNQEHQKIITEANNKGIPLRLLGALAFDLQCEKYIELRRGLGRQLSDLDYMSLSTQWGKIVDLLSSFGYSFDERRAMLHGLDRVIFFHPDGLRVDIFFDQLDMCHKIDFRHRLTIDPQTISLGDLLLEKLQIVRITEKDIIDVIVLFLDHAVSESDKDINGEYIAKKFASDWGFYHTATNNLQRIQNEFLDHYDSLNETYREVVRKRIEQLQQLIELEPKTMKWKLRAQVGTSVKWYKEVGELDR